MIARGDIFFADLDPIIGSEQGGVRPVVVIQNDTGNKFSPTVIVAAVTSSSKKSMPTHIKLEGTEGLTPKSIVLLEQIRTIDKSRLLYKIASLGAGKLREIDEALKISIGTEQ